MKVFLARLFLAAVFFIAVSGGFSWDYPQGIGGTIDFNKIAFAKENKDGILLLEKEPFIDMHSLFPLSEDGDKMASLGLGMGWIRGLWEKESSGSLDTLESFIEERNKVCIPRYSEPVIWEENTRYTMEDSGCGTQMFRSKVKKGDTAGSLFRAWLGSEEAGKAVKAVKSVFKLNRLRLGNTFSVERSIKDGRILRLMYDIDDEHRLVVRCAEDGFKASVEVYEFDTKMIRVRGKIETSLFDAVVAAGEDSSLALQLADVFSHQVNFLNEVQEGDTFEVVVEKKYIGSQFRRYGDIIAARFVNDGVLYEAFRFFDDDGSAHYYAADGSSLETQFLKAPLNFTRISSGYSLHRRHPVFGSLRPHQGVDYAAPRGTPVKALGDGVVTFVGWKRGYGKSIAIKHGGGIETHYAHLSRYAKKLKTGDKVEQGQVIAFVGATGTATGPHLDFRVKKNGKFIDPLKLTGGRSEPVSADKRRFFDSQVAQAKLLLEGEAILAVK